MANEKTGTFIIQVSSVDNADWQGTITWADEKKQKNFRSTLEMLKLMESALEAE